MTNSNAFDVDEVEVVEAFRDAFGRAFTRGGEDWLNAIPTDAHLTLGDVRRIKQGETIRVLEPQRYQSIVMLSTQCDFALGGAARKKVAIKQEYFGGK